MVGKRDISSRNLSFAENALAEEALELEVLFESLYKAETKLKMKISAEQNNLMTISTGGIQREIKVKRQKLQTVTKLKYLGAFSQMILQI